MAHFSFSRVVANLFQTTFLRNALISTVLILVIFPPLFYFITFSPLQNLISTNTEESAYVTAKQLAAIINPENQNFTTASISSPSKKEILEKYQSELKLEKIKIFSKTGEVVYSSNEQDVGKINNKSYFHETIAKGFPYTKIVEKENTTAEGRVVKVDVVETYVPIMRDNQFLGAFEIYYDITREHEYFHAIASAFTILWLTLSFLLLSSLSIIFYRSSKDLLSQRQVEEEKMLLKSKFKQEQSNKMEALGTLAGGIAHDFNNILAIMTGYTELALSMLDESREVKDELQEVLVASARARDLIQQILTFCRKSDEEKQTVKIQAVVNEVLKYLRLSLSPNIEIHTQIQSESSVLLDPARMHQVLMNLFTNSSQAIGDKEGIIEVKLTDVQLDTSFTRPYSHVKPGPFVQLTISDTGHGIKPDVIDQVFNPFFTTKKIGEGTGMGLSVVLGIVKNHGGIITVYSESEQGTTFHIYLPIASSKSPHEAKKAEPYFFQGTERILYVDDEKPLAEVSKKLLKSLGYDVEIQTNSLEALELIKSDPKRFDLIISDVSMPNMTGDELAKEITAFRPDMPIILCTGFSVRTSKEMSKELGIKAFITKPILKDSIAKTIRTVLDAAKKERRNRPTIGGA